MTKKYYNVVVSGGTEIELYGPYADVGFMTEEAKILLEDELDEEKDSIFKLVVNEDGIPSVFSYSNIEMEQ